MAAGFSSILLEVMTDAALPGHAELLAHTRWVEALALSLVRDPAAAADLAQSTLLAALEQSAPPANPRGWLARVMRNLLRERFRRESTRAGVEARGAREERLPGPDELVLRAECERRIVAAVLVLDEPHRSTLLLRYFEELSPEEIARRSGVPLATVTSRITRAHAALRVRLGDTDRREDWLAALAPILARNPGQLSSSPTPIASLSTLLLMSTATKIVIAFALGSALLWFALRDRETKSTEHAAALETSAPTQPLAPEPAVTAPPPAEIRQPVVESEPVKTAEAPPPAPAPTTGRIFGQIFRPDGQVAAKRNIRMLLAGKTEKKVVTDDEGKYDEDELAPGPWSISTWPGKDELAAMGKDPKDTMDGFAFLAQRTIDLAAGDEIELILGKPPSDGVRLRGHLLVDGQPVSGFLSFFPDGKDAIDRLQPAPATKAAGYELLLEGPGKYLVMASYGDARVEFSLEVPRAESHVRDFELPAATVHGRITGPGGLPVAGARVDMTPRAGSNPLHPNSTVTFSRVTDPDGNFAFKNISPARYALGVTSGSVGESKALVGAKTLSDVVVEDGVEPEPLAIELEEGAKVSGRVVNVDSAPRIVSLYVFDESGEPFNPITAGSVKKDGTFELFALAPGKYSVVGLRGDQASDVIPFTVPAAGEPDAIEMEMKPCAKLTVDITGRQPAWIDVRGAERACLSPLLDKHVFDRTYLRDWSQTSFFYRVPAGELTVIVRDALGGKVEQKVVVKSGERTAVDLAKR